MHTYGIPENVITGIIAGVSAGVILAILVEAKRYADFKIKKRGQIKYIRQIVQQFQEQVLSAQPVTITNPVGNPQLAQLQGQQVPLDVVRGAYFAGAFREIMQTLEGRADTLNFDEKKEVRAAFGAYNLILPGSDHFRPPSNPNEAGYHNIFDAFEAIKWLKVKGTDRTSLGLRPPEDGT